MDAYKDPNHPGNSSKHHTGKLCIEGCGRPAGTAWSPYWCFECNVRRMDRISEQFSALLEEGGEVMDDKDGKIVASGKYLQELERKANYEIPALRGSLDRLTSNIADAEQTITFKNQRIAQLESKIAAIDNQNRLDIACMDSELQLLRSRLTIAEETLKAIRDHEHCNSLVVDSICNELPREECGMLPSYHIGRIEGHRCCAIIANAAIKQIEELK